MRALRTKMEIEREKLKLMPSVLEPAGAQSTKSVDDIMAPLTSAPAKSPTSLSETKMPVIE
jgi:hypothetical protein